MFNASMSRAASGACAPTRQAIKRKHDRHMRGTHRHDGSKSLGSAKQCSSQTMRIVVTFLMLLVAIYSQLLLTAQHAALMVVFDATGKSVFDVFAHLSSHCMEVAPPHNVLGFLRICRVRPFRLALYCVWLVWLRVCESRAPRWSFDTDAVYQVHSHGWSQGYNPERDWRTNGPHGDVRRVSSCASLRWFILDNLFVGRCLPII